MEADAKVSERAHNGAFMQALGAEFGMLNGARGATISESSSRSSLYMTTLSACVVALAPVAQGSRFGVSFFIFALAITPVVVAFLLHQWRTWMKVAAALPMAAPAAPMKK